MPELPEVETIARNLREGRGSPSILDRRIRAADLRWRRTLAEPSRAEFLRRVVGQRIRTVGRRAKFLRLDLTRDTLLIHLRMSGDLHVRPSAQPPAPHDRLVLHFEDGLALAFHDTRKFGRVWLTDDPDHVLGNLGPEPLDPALTAARFAQMLRARHRLLKPLLLDQTFLAGLGNIYTDEALHLARLHPLQSSDTLTEEQAATLLRAIRSVLRAGIRSHGASIDWVYRGGDFQNHFRAYGRAGQPCPTCGRPIRRLTVGQRGTHICPACQRLR